MTPSFLSVGLPPVFDRRTEIMILGSFPSVISLEKRQYYANPGNDFWRVMSDVVSMDLAKLPYNRRIEALLGSKIGMWNVFRSCVREGSSDSTIRSFTFNDFSIMSDLPLKVVLISGRTPYKAYASCPAKPLVPYHYIDSTSGANRRTSAKEKARRIADLIGLA